MAILYSRQITIEHSCYTYPAGMKRGKIPQQDYYRDCNIEDEETIEHMLCNYPGLELLRLSFLDNRYFNFPPYPFFFKFSFFFLLNGYHIEPKATIHAMVSPKAKMGCPFKLT